MPRPITQVSGLVDAGPVSVALTDGFQGCPLRRVEIDSAALAERYRAVPDSRRNYPGRFDEGRFQLSKYPPTTQD